MMNDRKNAITVSYKEERNYPVPLSQKSEKSLVGVNKPKQQSYIDIGFTEESKVHEDNKFVKFFKDNPTVGRVAYQEYKVIRMIPDNRFRDKDFLELINVMYGTYRQLKDRFDIEESVVEYNLVQPIFFEILMEEEITFNFAVPNKEVDFVKNRIQSMFPMSTLVIQENDYIEQFLGEKMYTYKYEKNSICSLGVTGGGEALNHILGLKKDIKKGDKLLLQISMLPQNLLWKEKFDDMFKEIKKGNDVTNTKHPVIKFLDGALKVVDNTMDFIDETIVELAIDKKNKKEIEKEEGKKLLDTFSTESRQKTRHDGFKVEIKSLIKTESKSSAYDLAKGVETAYKDLAKDNSIVMSTKLKTVKEKDIKRIPNLFNKDIMGSLELAQIVRLPDATVQRRHRMPSIKVNQVQAPREIKNGKIKFGEMTTYGKTIDVNFSTNEDDFCRPTMLYSGMGGGKTTEMLGVMLNSIDSGVGIIFPDYIKHCEVGRMLLKKRPKVKKVDFSDLKNAPIYFGFPEIPILPTDTPRDRLEKANTISYEMVYIVNALAENIDPLSPRMRKYLQSACRVVFCHADATWQQMIDVLEIEEIRNKYVNRAISEGVIEEGSRDELNLRALDDKPQLVDHVLERLSVVTDDVILNELLQKKADYSTSFVDLIDNGESVVFLLDEDIFPNKIVKGIFTTYLYSRVMLAMSRRRNMSQPSIVVLDELHQVMQLQSLLIDRIAEVRKFKIGMLACCHYLTQLTPKLQDAVLNVGSNHMLLAGVGENAVRGLMHLVDKNNFEEGDILDLEPFTSFNIFTVSNKRCNFISNNLPKIDGI